MLVHVGIVHIRLRSVSTLRNIPPSVGIRYELEYALQTGYYPRVVLEQTRRVHFDTEVEEAFELPHNIAALLNESVTVLRQSYVSMLFVTQDVLANGTVVLQLAQFLENVKMERGLEP